MSQIYMSVFSNNRNVKLISILVSFVLLFANCSKSTSTTTNPAIYISANDVFQSRDTTNSVIKFSITVQPQSSQAVSLKYATVEGTAKANIDFIPVSGTLNIAANTAQGIVEVNVIGKKTSAGNQEFYLQLSDASNAILQVNKATATLQNVATAGPTLVWSDEFNGTTLNTSYWNYETGGGGWGNNELQNYTSGTSNAYIESGNLVIEAKKESLGGSNYTSARLTTQGKKSFTYGRIDIRAKVPVAKGIWPALWMLGENINTTSWPACGEIDIMENIGEMSPSKDYGTAHWGVSTSAHLSKGGSVSQNTGLFSDDYHIYSLNWTPNSIEWLLDGTKYYEVAKSDITGGNMPFDKPFFLIMNVAVGGNWPGSPTAATTFPQKMYVDYIRVYQ